MKFMLWAAFGALSAAMPAPHAQPQSRTPDPAEPMAAVPPIVYASALAGYAPAPKDGPTPDKAWRAANQTVAGQPGHGDGHGAQPATPPEPRKHDARHSAKPAAAPRDHRQHH